MSRISLLALTVISIGARAENVKTFLDAAEQGNVDRKISIEQRNRAAAEYRQAWTALLPSLSISAGWTNNQYEVKIPNFQDLTAPKTTIVPKDQFDSVFRFEVPLIDTQRWFRMGAANAAADSASLRELVTRDLVRRQVVASFYGYAASLAVMESAKKSAAVAAEQLKLQEIRASVGTVTELDLLRSRAEVARTRQVVADTISLVNTSRRTVRTLTALEPPEQLPLPIDDITPSAPLADFEARVDLLPAVQAADKDAKGAGSLATAARLAMVPTVSAQFTERASNAASLGGQSVTYNTGVNLTWRLDVPSVMNMQAQSANEQVALLGGDRTRLQARDQINSDWQRLQAALIKIEAAKAQVDAARRATKVASDRYAAGAATQVDVIQAERDVFIAEVSQIQARTELATARASLQISSALPLD